MKCIQISLSFLMHLTKPDESQQIERVLMLNPSFMRDKLTCQLLIVGFILKVHKVINCIVVDIKFDYLKSNNLLKNS